MSSVDERPARWMLAAVPVGLTTLVWAVAQVPGEILVQGASILAAWLMLSVPIGLIVGHCVLDDDTD
jgi:hypothetical protein